mgnify:CR=1 FL=1
MAEIIYREESYKIMGACFEVYKEKGCGFTESVCQECLQIEFRNQGIPFVAQPVIELEYKGTKLVVELKALSKLIDEHRAQALNYLHATKFRLCLLVNFGHHPKVEYERIVV